jgi:16S rRNA (guanine527-N7)-methyltransferase
MNTAVKIPRMTDRELLCRGLNQLGFTGEKHTALTRVMESYLDEWELFNKTLKLTSETARKDVIVKHIFDSLSARAHIQNLPALQGDSSRAPPVVADIGSGGGFPGIPLAACMPDVRFVLIERMQKRCAFLENCAALLGLSNVTVENTPVEQVQKHRFDVCVFRSFHPLDAALFKMLAECVLPGGFLAAYKGRREKIDEEMRALGAIVPSYSVKKLTVPFLEDHERHVVIVRTGELSRGVE